MRSCIATKSFWQGVDVPGRALSMVIVDRLPFPSPAEPVFSARCRAIDSEGRSSFMALSLPLAAMDLKQGFGRLIRRPARPRRAGPARGPDYDQALRPVPPRRPAGGPGHPRNQPGADAPGCSVGSAGTGGFGRDVIGDLAGETATRKPAAAHEIPVASFPDAQVLAAFRALAHDRPTGVFPGGFGGRFARGGAGRLFAGVLPGRVLAARVTARSRRRSGRGGSF